MLWLHAPEHDYARNLPQHREGLARRDRRVAEFATRLGCARVALPAGGYSPDSPRRTAGGFAEIAAVHHRNAD